MKKHLTIILILTLILIGCRQNSKSELNTEKLNRIEITDKFKLEFLNQILSDSSETKILFDKKELISNLPLLPPPILPIDKDNRSKSISHANFISDTLSINDLEFVKNQFFENRKFDLSKISDFGFNVIDIKGFYIKNIKWDSINKIADDYYKENNLANYSQIFYMTKPLFNKELNLAYVRIRQGSGGMTLIFEKIHQNWNLKYKFGEWVE